MGKRSGSRSRHLKSHLFQGGGACWGQACQTGRKLLSHSRAIFSTCPLPEEAGQLWLLTDKNLTISREGWWNREVWGP